MLSNLLDINLFLRFCPGLNPLTTNASLIPGRAYKWTGFYTIGASVIKELNLLF